MNSSNLESQESAPSENTNGATNRRSDGANGASRKHHPPAPAWRNAVENFTPMWFAIPMNTGILGIIMHQLPYQFHGLQVLSTIMYIFDLLLFVVFSIITILRWTVCTRTAMRQTAASVEEISFLSAPPIAFLTLTALTGLIPSNAYWGGHAWSILAYVMWWIGTIWILALCVGSSIIIFRTNICRENGLSPAIFLTAVGVATAALYGAMICNYAYDISPRLAVPVIIVGYFLAGMTIWLSVILYGLYFHQLMLVGWPAPAKRPSIIMSVGPFGQAAGAMQLLGAAAMTKMDFAGYNKGTLLTASAASGVNAASAVFALIILGHDIFWLICSLFAILEAAFKRELSYSLAWWSTIFPVGTTTTAFLILSVSMNSPTFRVLTTIFLLVLLINYFINWGFTIYYTIYGHLLIKEDHDDKEEAKMA